MRLIEQLKPNMAIERMNEEIKMNIKTNKQSELINLFEKLSSKHFKQLRPWQNKLLSFWLNRIENKQLVSIKIPTGTGKTLVGLIILEYYRRQGKSVLYVANDYFLAENVIQHCESLNIPARLIESKSRAKDQVERMLILNEYHNDKNIIGVTVNKNLLLSRDLNYPDILLIDDADSFIPDLRERFSIKIERQSFPTFWQEIVDKLSKDRYETSFFKDITPEKGIISELVYFPDFWELIDNFETFFHEKMKEKTLSPSSEHSNLYWQIKNNGNDWKKYFLIVSNRDLELSPYIPPSLSKLSFKDLNKLILMSATLNQGALINWEFGINFSNREIIDEDDFNLKEFNTGSRVIFPVSDVEDRNQAYEDIFQKFNKTIFATPSHRIADKIIETLESISPNSEILKYSGDVEEIDAFNESDSGCLVIAGRYFGLDLDSVNPQVLVITHVPYILYNIDYIQKNKFSNEDIYFDRISRRLVQVFGRCNRHEDDQTACIVLDPTFFQDYTTNRRLLTNFSTLIKAEVTLGFEYAEKRCELSTVLKKVDSFFGKRFNYFADRVPIIKSYKELPPTNGRTLGILEEVGGWNSLISDDFIRAQEMFERAATQLTNISHPSKTESNRIALNFYLAAMSAYYNYQKGGKDADEEVCKNFLKKSRESSDLRWFNQLQLLPILPKDETIKPEEFGKFQKKLQIWRDDPQEFFGLRIWESKFLEKYQEEFKQAFKILLDLDSPESFGTRIHVVFERILQDIASEHTEIEYENPGIFDCISALKTSHLIRKETLKEGTVYKNNPNFLRNLNLHRGKDDKSFTNALKTFMSWHKLVELIIEDLAMFFFLKVNMDSVFFENLKSYIQYSKKSDTILEKIILKGFSDGKVEIMPEWIGNSYRIKKARIQLQGGVIIDLNPSKD